MTLSAAAKIQLIETALVDGKYRTLQRQLRELKDAEQIITRCSLSNSHDLLKAKAQRLIDELRPVAETQNLIETVEQKIDEVLVSLPTEIVEQKINEVLTFLLTGTIVDKSDFGDRINTGNADEKKWLVKKDGTGEGVTSLKTECGRYWESHAGDAVRLQADAQKLGLTLHLYDRPNDTEPAQDAINMQKSSFSDNQADTYPVPEDQIEFFDIPREGMFHYNGRSSWDNCDVMGTIKESKTGNPIYLVYGLGEYQLVEEVSFAVTYPVGYLKKGRIR